MKIKPLILTLAVLTAITFSACDSSKESLQIPESSITSMNSDQEVSEIKTSSVNNLDFDFDEAILDIELFGNKISLPCTFEEFGSDFELYEDISIPFSDGQKNLQLCSSTKVSS